MSRTIDKDWDRDSDTFSGSDGYYTSQILPISTLLTSNGEYMKLILFCLQNISRAWVCALFACFGSRNLHKSEGSYALTKLCEFPDVEETDDFAQEENQNDRGHSQQLQS